MEERTKLGTLNLLAMETEEYVLNTRRRLHASPELRFEEEWTLGYIMEEVQDIAPLRVTRKAGGIYYDFNFNSSYDWILFRADVDALPVPEETGLSFASQIPGKSHACGHDVNTAMLLGAMKLIAEGKVTPKHNIRFVFQRAEENPITESGGAMLVREGVCEGISAAYALHIYTEDEAKSGQFQTRRGRFFSNSGRLKITVKCDGGHVAFPNHGSSATDIMLDLGMALRGFNMTQLGPDVQISFVPASFNAGSVEASNVRPKTATLWYAVRHFLPADQHAKFLAALEAKIRAVVSGFPDASVTVEYFPGHPPLINSPEVTEKVMKLLTDATEEVVEIDPVYGGEDFAHYTNAVPGTMVFLGAWQEGSGGHHTGTFNPDESVFWKGVLYWLLLATR